MKIISLQNIDTFYNKGDKEFTLASDQRLTPSAKDHLVSLGVQITYPKSCRSLSSTKVVADKSLIERITAILVKDYNITNEDQLVVYIKKVLKMVS